METQFFVWTGTDITETDDTKTVVWQHMVNTRLKYAQNRLKYMTNRFIDMT